jgi:hypothetical protein
MSMICEAHRAVLCRAGLVPQMSKPQALREIVSECRAVFLRHDGWDDRARSLPKVMQYRQSLERISELAEEALYRGRADD